MNPQSTSQSPRYFRFHPVLLLAASLLAGAPARTESGIIELSIDFSQPEPVAKGLTFNRESTEFREETIRGVRTPVWVAPEGNLKKHPNLGVFHLVVTDPDVLGRGLRVVDAEVEYSGLGGKDAARLFIREGAREETNGWGRRGSLKQVEVTSNRFQPAIGRDPESDWDFRLVSYADKGLALHSVTLRFYDPDQHPVWTRMLDPRGLEAPFDTLVFEPGESYDIGLKVHNLAHVPARLFGSVELRERGGEVLATQSAPLDIPAGEEGLVPFRLDTADLPRNVYRLVFQVGGGPDHLRVVDEVYFAVSERQFPPAREPGEPRFGLDPVNGDVYDNPARMWWVDFMGADILRSEIQSNMKLEEMNAAAAVLREHGIESAGMVNIPFRTQTREQAEAFLRETIPVVQHMVTAYADVMPYLEMGNEPDLTVFFAGSMELYIHIYHEIARAVREVNPDMLLMNGGLSYAHKEGNERSTRFVELVDPDLIDVFAFHSHGFGAAALNKTLVKMRRDMERFGKTGKRLVDTETGLSASTPVQEDLQAATAVQKLVFARAEGLDFALAFRLVFRDGTEYAFLLNDAEPRPAVLAYHHMVMRLRGLDFIRRLETDSDTTAYLFADPVDGRRAVVAWTEPGQRASLPLSLGERPESGVTIHDLYGNPSTAEVLQGNQVLIGFNHLPTFATWRGNAALEKVEKAKPVFGLSPRLELPAGQASTLTVPVVNPFNTSLSGRVALEAFLPVDARVATPPVDIELAPGERRELAFQVEVAGETSASIWPANWRVFPYAATEPGLEAAREGRLPSTLPSAADGSPLHGVRGTLDADHQLDIDELAGGYESKAAAFVFGEVLSPGDQTVRIGLSADWWMRVFLNGEPVFDTLADGNDAPQSPTAHLVDLPLREGRNVLAVMVLSGKGGWKLSIAEPATLRRLLNPGASSSLVATLTAGDSILARATTAVELITSVAPGNPDDWRTWLGTPPQAYLGGGEVTNFYELEPDSSRWWGGPDDLSARLWLRAGGQRLLVLAAVRDDIPHRNGKGGDALHLAWRAGEGPERSLTVRFDEDRTPDIAAGVSMRTQRDEDTRHTYYLVEIPLEESGTVRLNAEIEDWDADYREQVLRWRGPVGEAAHPDRWFPLVLPAAGE